MTGRSENRNGFRRPGIVFFATVVALATTWGYQFVFSEQGGRYSSDNIGLTVTKNTTMDISNHEKDWFEREKAFTSIEKNGIEMQEQKAIQNQQITIEKLQDVSRGKNRTAGKGHETEGTEVGGDGDEDGDGSGGSKGNDNGNVESTTDKPKDAAWNSMVPTKRAQVENYRNKKALIINLHPTHHGGTTFCGRVGKSGGSVPSFACMGDKREVTPSPPPCRDGPDDGPFCYSYNEIKARKTPWTKSETGPFVEIIRPYFHMISWEFSGPSKVKLNGRTLQDTDWDHPNVLSVVITRDPMSRLLAGDGAVGKRYPGFDENGLSREGWWNYAVYGDDNGTDNFFLRILTALDRPTQKRNVKNHVKKGFNRTTEELIELFPTGIDEEIFEQSKSLLDQFTIVLDIACLNEGMDALADLLHIQLPPQGKKRKNHTHAAPRERIGYDDVYEYLLAKNQWGIALYEYSKTISLVRCDDLHGRRVANGSNRFY